MRHIIGEGSAAVLGDITAGRRGREFARSMYRIWKDRYHPYKRKNLSLNSNNTMPPINRSKSRSSAAQRVPSRGRDSVRSMSISTSQLRGRTPSRAPTNRSTTSKAASRAVVASKGTTNVVKNRKKPKVDAKFRAKVQQSLEDRMVTSYFQETYWNNHQFLNVNNNTQRVQYIGFGQYFDPLVFNDAASVLFNGKTPVSRTVRTEVGDFDKKNIKFYVKSSSLAIDMKNNSTKKYHVVLYSCSPKQATIVDGAGPIETWGHALTLDATDGTNVANSNYDILHMKPDNLAMFKKYWKFEKKTMSFEAGESINFTIPGPKDYWLDFKKFFIKDKDGNDSFIRRQKFVVSPFIVFYPELSAGIDTGVATIAGRLSGDDNSDGHDLLYETTFRCAIGMPERTGFTETNPSSGTVVNLDKRKPSYSIKQYPEVYAFDEYVSVNPQQPAQNADQ